ncbi:uncharacterized protein TNIN_40461 [Trichonephila inaurata madagascariensis]|uniref:Uncharacterized protein n=1 Tax=Trichonephila inaurata madagascariensis TaxID=2747483 RepID=A0A8X7CMW9_9ARAC|nr:uncharacterized protein TNIN_40461 [Trichonephila inaurata madagascariensis]
MASDPIFTHLIQELYSDSYVARLGSISDIIKDCKPKGYLTKSLLELLPKVFDVLEIVVKICWSNYIDENLQSMVDSAVAYVSYAMMGCWIERNTVPDIFDRFLIALTFVNYLADLIYCTTAKKYYKLTPKILTVFFENVLMEDFKKRGGWKRLEKHILSKNYLEYHYECSAYDFVYDNIPKDLKQKMRESYAPLLASDSNITQIRTGKLLMQNLVREVLISVTTSFLTELSPPSLSEEQSDSEETEGSSSTEAKVVEDPYMYSRGIDYRLCESRLNRLEEKLRQLISIFELLEAE